MEPVVHLTPSCGLRGKLIPKPTSTEEEARDVYNFRGVPYAEPPVGSLRFADPKPVSLWSGVRLATEFGAACPQDFSMLDDVSYTVPRPESVSEDCLYLNVWTPSLNGESRLPVMVWIYGGGFLTGCSDIFDLKELACFHNVVVVTFNYRLAALGFLTVKDGSSNGNYGILDQIEALKWVQKYISLFGGDPQNVTILGQSAGSISVSLLVVSPLTKGLFRRAISQSGTVFSGDFGCQTSESAFAKMYAHMSKTLPGCPPSTASGSEIVDYLRQQSTDDLVTAFKGFQFTAVLDGRVFPNSTTELYERGEFNDCDLIAGCNSDEGELMFDAFASKVVPPGGTITFDLARTIVTIILSVLWTVEDPARVFKAIVDEYLPEGVDYTPEELRKSVTECFGDFLCVFPTIRAANCHSRRCKTYVYQFCHRPPYAKYPDYARADHGSEVFYALRMFAFGINFDDTDARLARLMATYWTNFARSGNPNGEGLEDWPDYDETTRRHLVIDLQPRSDSKLKDRRANFWLRQLPKLVNLESRS